MTDQTDMPGSPTLGIIGGSGLYTMPGLEDTRELVLGTPFGEPSSPLVVGTLELEKHPARRVDTCCRCSEGDDGQLQIRAHLRTGPAARRPGR